jgi:hypothetical protein
MSYYRSLSASLSFYRYRAGQWAKGEEQRAESRIKEKAEIVQPLPFEFVSGFGLGASSFRVFLLPAFYLSRIWRIARLFLSILYLLFAIFYFSA